MSNVSKTSMLKKTYLIVGSFLVLLMVLALSFPYLSNLSLQRNLENARRNVTTSSDKNVRINALNMLRQYGNKHDIPLFARLLDDPDVVVCVPAADALSEFTGITLPIPETMNGANVFHSSNPEAIRNIKTSILSDKKAVSEYIASWKVWWNSEGKSTYTTNP